MQPHLREFDVSYQPTPAKPAAFQERYLATQPVPYSFIESSGRTSSSGGVLRSGESVWLEKAIQREQHLTTIQGYVESVGMIVVDRCRFRKSNVPS